VQKYTHTAAQGRRTVEMQTPRARSLFEFAECQVQKVLERQRTRGLRGSSQKDTYTPEQKIFGMFQSDRFVSHLVYALKIITLPKICNCLEQHL